MFDHIRNRFLHDSIDMDFSIFVEQAFNVLYSAGKQD